MSPPLCFRGASRDKALSAARAARPSLPIFSHASLHAPNPNSNLIYLQPGINPPHEQGPADHPQGPAQKEESRAEDEGVAKVERRLEKTRHLRLHGEVVDGVEEDVAGRGSGGHEGEPLPVVVLHVQEEVDRNDGSADAHHHQDQVHEEEEVIDVVKLVVPKASKNKIHLDEDGAEGEDAGHGRDEGGVRVPRTEGNGPRHAVDAARKVGFPSPVPAEKGAHHGQGERDEEPDSKDLGGGEEGSVGVSNSRFLKRWRGKEEWDGKGG